MSFYREVRVRPVVRYVVTLYESEDDGLKQSGGSTAFGTFDNAIYANIVGEAIAERERRADKNEASDVVFEPARPLRIDWLRGPGEPQEAIRWELSEVEAPPAP